MAIYPIDYISQLKNIFLGLVSCKNLDNSSNDGSEKFNSHNANSNSNSNFISTSCENNDDIDGKPLLDDYKKEDSNDIDGKPLNEVYEDDIDGKPCKFPSLRFFC